jgi:hypothetical protein
MPLVILHRLLNVSVQLANKKGLKNCLVVGHMCVYVQQRKEEEGAVRRRKNYAKSQIYLKTFATLN